MRITFAQLPATGQGDDRVFVTDHGVIVLDGASAFRPTQVPARIYAETLGLSIQHALLHDPRAPLVDVLRECIRHTATKLHLEPGHSPSSTVTIARVDDETLQVVTLGDNLVVFPDVSIVDDRIELGLEPSHEYRRRLAQGTAYDDKHHALLADLQAQQVAHRNRAGGYWIAETNPTAADHSVTIIRPLTATPWMVIATDGAYQPIHHLAFDNWATLAHADTGQLSEVLGRCQQWESDTDPNGAQLPRAKVHDDKTIVAALL